MGAKKDDDEEKIIFPQSWLENIFFLFLFFALFWLFLIIYLLLAMSNGLSWTFVDLLIKLDNMLDFGGESFIVHVN